jgi:SAM-dependent methyltransferase
MTGGTGDRPEQEQTAAVRGADSIAYVLPRHPAELDRLDVQHYALREALGAHYLAPIEQPARILDVGAGTGQWGYDLCREFPAALTVGFDLLPPKPGAPPRYWTVRGNVLRTLPFADGRFDFVHQRLMMTAIPVRHWRRVVGELVRVLSPGGWLELVEGNVEFESSGPATDRLAELLRRLSRSSGIDSTGIVFRDLKDHMAQGGLLRLRRKTFPIALGDWGGRVGTLFASDCRALYLRLAPVFETRFGVPVAECYELVAGAQREWEELHTTYSFGVGFGQKPGG